MTYAYVKLTVEPGKETEIRESLRKIPSVKSADIVTGQEDIITKIQGESAEKLLHLVRDQLRKISGIKGSTTSIVVD